MKLIKEILKGILIGIANIIPGVSGGTMAVSMGIYDKIIGSITNMFSDFKKSMKTLAPYGIGMLLGIGALSFVIGYLFENFPLQTSMAFIGLIFGGLPVLIKKVKGARIDIINILLFLAFFALVIGLPLISGGEKEASMNLSIVLVIQLFFIGVIASATMVIPGVSGSMVLMILGYYEPIIRTIKVFIESVFSFDITQMLSGVGILAPFGIGVLVGIFAIAKLIEVLLNKFPIRTYYSILGLVIASPIAVLYNTKLDNLNFLVIFVSIIVFGIGCAIAFMLGKDDGDLIESD